MLDLLLPTACVVCASPGTGLCRSCASQLEAAPTLAAPPGLRASWSLLSYDGVARDLVAALKFRNRRDAITLLGAAMAELVDGPVDVVTWAPTSAPRVRARGYDQAELLARAVAGSLGRPCSGLLRRVDRAGQTGRDRAQRLAGPEFAARRRPAGDVLVVDDVRTTGATLCAASDVLLGAGARSTAALTLAVRV